jgi:hypothetical protein
MAHRLVDFLLNWGDAGQDVDFVTQAGGLYSEFWSVIEAFLGFEIVVVRVRFAGSGLDRSWGFALRFRLAVFEVNYGFVSLVKFLKLLYV